MGIKVRTYLDGLQVTDPINITDLELSVIRDPQTHGVGFEASTLSLNFIDDAYEYIEEKKRQDGLKANVVCKIVQNCSDDDDIWETIIEGKLNMGQRKKSCGASCMVSIPIESNSCEVLLNNMYDQKVDMDKAVAFDQLTTLPAYFGLGIDMTLPTREISVVNEGYVLDAGDTVDMSWFNGLLDDSNDKIALRATYSNKLSENINQSELEPTESFSVDHGFLTGALSPIFLYDDVVKCFSGSFDYSFRLKGRADIENSALIARLDSCKIRVALGEYPDNLTDLHTQALPYTNTTNHFSVHTDFDYTFSGTVTIPPGIGIYVFIEMYGEIIAVGNLLTGSVVFAKESHAKISAVKACPPTTTKAYLVHEALSHITEASTNYCARVKSSYYGRTDSEPFDFPYDGCGGLRLVTSGLKIRNAENATFFASLKDLITGLQAIDNIGMAPQEDPDRPGYLLLRVEDLDFFYRDHEIFRCPAIADGQESYDLTGSYSKINVGYKKWETQANFGLDEFNSTREYRTSLNAVSNTLDITSNLVAGEYPIEVSREQQYVDTNAADTSYDDEIFIICLKRITAAGYPYGEMVVELGNVASPENMFSPASVYNYGISPFRNLMRWFRTIAAAYPNISDLDNKLFFNAGTGNILAKGELSAIYGGTCRLEGQPVQENQDLFPGLFQDKVKATPLWRNEVVNYDYPMSLADYNKIKADPYGYISYQCGNGDWESGYLVEIGYKPFDGMGSFKLKKKW